ncbi:glycosyltransferase family 2 protein [Deinococcus sp. Marseille-Q6407]|uniref:glycosyltransferase family 2 protein n=1 Tax=Deinococcus sp. Marseille-Q6407 TaxID=2969223 RepID=UPI0021C080A9|nr:glycosyltransferase [Deinococcus sp. Marseille-Q6407]
MFVSVIIASRGRPQVLAETVKSILQQARRPDEIIIAVTTTDDVLPGMDGSGVQVIISPPGSSVQRNEAIAALNPASDLVVFLDDDVEVASDYLIKVTNFMEVVPDVAAFSSTPVLDKAMGGRLPREEAKAILVNSLVSDPDVRSARGLYGCNMVVRAKYARREKFDERLVSYAWLEDRDYGIRMEKYGAVVNYDGGRIVHFGTPGGRISEVRMGYIQIMNPAYLFFVKKELTFREYVDHGINGFLANLAHRLGVLTLLRPQSIMTIDRNQRLKGNFLALRDIFIGKLDPRLVLEVESR